MQNGSLTAEAYASALLDQAAATASLNAFINIDREATLEAARRADKLRATGSRLGVLHGLPIPVKDAINTAALPMTAGTGALLGFRPADDAPIVRSLFAAGALLMGKTNIHEMSYGWTSTNSITGAVRNPYDPTRIPGGSSGGSASAVAARVAPIAVAEDTFGSIRIPASMCGLCGLRPTFLRYPNAGIMPVAPKFLDMPGPLGRSVTDLALFDAALTGDNQSLKATPLDGVRIGIAPDYFLAGLDPEVERVMRQTIEKLRAAGVTLVWVNLPSALDNAMWHGFSIQSRDTVPSVKAFLEEHRTGVSFDELLEKMSPELRDLFKLFSLPGGGAYATPEAYQLATEQMVVIKQAIHDYFRQQDVAAIVFPPALIPPPPIGVGADVDIRGSKVPFYVAMSRNVAIGSCAGLPGLVLPAGLTAEGLPIGIEFDAPSGTDRQLLALGLSLEKVLGQLPAPKMD